MPDNHEPTTSSSECDVPRMSGMTINLGWFARESKLDSNWDAMAYELSIDGEKIDLAGSMRYSFRGENGGSLADCIEMADQVGKS